MDWLLSDSIGSLFSYLALLMELLGLILVLVEGLRPKKARFVECWIGQRAERKPVATRLKAIFKTGGRPDFGWLMVILVAIAFEKMVVGTFSDRSPFEGIFLSLARLLLFGLVLGCGMVLFRIISFLGARSIVWVLEKLKTVSSDRALGGVGMLLLFTGLSMNVLQVLLY